jgi:hypothetical protein
MKNLIINLILLLLALFLFSLVAEAKTTYIIVKKSVSKQSFTDRPVNAIKYNAVVSKQAGESVKRTVVPFTKFLTEKGAKNREWVLSYVSKYFQGDELVAFDNILKKEAGYREDAVNGIGACGMPQALPCSKMNCPLNESGLECQVQWFIGYINRRYGSPSEAWRFHLINNWY